MTVDGLLDSENQRRLYIRNNIVEVLVLEGPSQLLRVTTLGGETSEETPKSGIYPFTNEGRFKSGDRGPRYFQNFVLLSDQYRWTSIRTLIFKAFAESYLRSSVQVHVLLVQTTTTHL